MTVKKVRGNYSLNLYISKELRDKLATLSKKYDRTMADIVRSLLKIGIPMMEGMSVAEEIMAKEYIGLVRRLRKVKSLKDI